MALGFRVSINPKILRWARESAYLEVNEAARKIGINPEILKKCEEGEQKLTVNQLRKAASVYKRPLATFYFPEVPEDIKPVHDFRILPSDSEFVKPPALIFEIRRASVRRELTLQLSDDIGEGITQFERTAKLTDDLEQLSKELRTFLGISLVDQYRWRDEYEALRSWKEALENVGVLVLQASRIPLRVMRGFSISEPILPVIVLNAADSPRARIFTLLHETGHLLLSDGGVCDLREVKGVSSKNQRTEIFCNHLAGIILVPTKELQSMPEVIEKRKDKEWRESDISSIADKFKVSKQVILRRLLIIGKITTEFYRKKIEEYEEIASIKRLKKQEGGPSVALRTVANNGFRFTRLVLNAFYGDLITAADVSNYLGVKLGHLSEIEKHVGY